MILISAFKNRYNNLIYQRLQKKYVEFNKYPQDSHINKKTARF